MKNTTLFIALLSSLAFLWTGCTEDDSVQPFVFEGVSYDGLTRLNGDNTAMYDNRDDNVYAVTNIGGKIWMAENLRFVANGSYTNPSNPDAIYGRLYDWNAAKEACPEGWHLPNDIEWQSLELALGMPSGVVNITGWRDITKMTEIKSETGWNTGANGNNALGFNLFPAGRYELGTYYNLGDYAFFWTSTLTDASNAWARYFYRSYNQVRRDDIAIGNGHSCRCLLD